MSQDRLSELVAKWRKLASDNRAYTPIRSGIIDECIDELEAILAQPDDTAAPRNFEKMDDALQEIVLIASRSDLDPQDLLGDITEIAETALATQPAAPAAGVTAGQVRQAMDSAIKKTMKPDEAPNATVKHYIGVAQFQIMAEELNALLAAATKEEMICARELAELYTGSVVEPATHNAEGEDDD